MTRPEILDAAKKIVTGDRERAYSAPENSFATVANLWNAYMGGHYFKTKDVAAMLALLKIARIASGNFHMDNWVDLAGYAACGGEVESNEADMADVVNSNAC